jgi:hypothetical protein
LDEELSVSDGNADASTFTVGGRWIPIEIPSTSGDVPATTQIRHLDMNGYAEQPRLRSNTISDSMFVTNGDDEVLKFDGDNLYQAGLFRWQAQLFSQVDTTTGSITIDDSSIAWTAKSANRFTVASGDAVVLPVGARVQDDSNDAIYTVVSVTTNATNDFIYLDRAITSVAANGNLTRVSRYSYYFRLRAIDANQNVVVSAATGASDCVIEMSEDAQIKHRLLGMPAFAGYDFDRIELDVFRTKRNTAAPFFLVKTVAVPFNSGEEYIDITDASPDEILRDSDNVTSALLGEELGSAWDQPLRAKYVTTTGSRLVTANLKGYPEIDVTLRRKSGTASLATSDLAGKKWLLRKDNTDASTTSNLTDRQAYEFVSTAGAVTIDPATDITNDAGAEFTVTEVGHGLVAGNWVYLYHSAAGTTNSLQYAGWFKIASATADTFTCTLTHSSSYTPGATDVDRYIAATAKVDIPVLVGTDGNYNSVDSNPTTSYDFVAMLRLANAMNASMRVCGTPWFVANAGSEYNAGQLVLRQPQVSAYTMELVVPALVAATPFDVFVNNILRDSGEQVSAQTLLFPSRLGFSYENYPEIFDNPAGPANFSDSVLDVNAADGQEITMALPFFGESSFGSGQSESKVIVLKTSSLYQVDLRTRQYQKIEQPYGGCTVPASVTQTKDGITFANESGIYRLNRDLSVSWMGEAESRRWKEEVNQDALDAATGHNYLNGSQYKLSVPVGQDNNNQVFVFDYTQEDKGSWVRHDNHPATGWANLGTKDSLFSTTNGQVYKIRSANDATDYRDDAAAINMEIITRGEDFDLPGVRKAVSGVHIEFHNDSGALSNVEVSTSANMEATFTPCDTLDLESSTRQVEGFWFSVAKRKLERIQTKIACSTKDAPVVVAGISYRVAALDDKGAREAAQA